MLIDRQFRADDGSQTRLLRGLMESRRAVHAIGVEQRERGIAERGRALDERFGQRRSLQEAEGRRGVELDVHGSIDNALDEPSAFAASRLRRDKPAFADTPQCDRRNRR